MRLEELGLYSLILLITGGLSVRAKSFFLVMIFTAISLINIFTLTAEVNTNNLTQRTDHIENITFYNQSVNETRIYQYETLTYDRTAPTWLFLGLTILLIINIYDKSPVKISGGLFKQRRR